MRLFRLWRSAGSLCLSVLLLGGTVMASPSAGTHGYSASGAQGAAASGGGTSGAGTAHSANPTSTAAGSQLPLGRSVAATVYAAHQSGAGGPVLAAAIRSVLANENANARGLSVAQAVYTRLSANAMSGNGPFADVPAQAPWALAAVNALQQAGVVQGTSSTTFSPNQPVTLAELATMLARLQAGSASQTTSVPAGTPSWAEQAMAWAESNAVLAGEENLGSPGAPLTRAQAVLMLINASGLAPEASLLSHATIALTGTPPPWAHGALALAIQLGLLRGSNGQLLANQPLTRAQMAVLLARLAVLESVAASAAGS